MLQTPCVRSLYRERLSASVSRLIVSRWTREVAKRRNYTTAALDSALPLKGYRVLDMTRVLAGVSLYFKLLWERLAYLLNSHIVHKFSEILGIANLRTRGSLAYVRIAQKL
jgi:hypothetical protein